MMTYLIWKKNNTNFFLSIFEHFLVYLNLNFRKVNTITIFQNSYYIDLLQKVDLHNQGESTALSTLVFKSPDTSKPFVVRTVASDIGIRRVFYSMKTMKHSPLHTWVSREQRYSPTEKEILGNYLGHSKT